MAWTGTILLAHLLVVIVTANEVTYIVGGWLPQDREVTRKVLSPIFQDFLTEEVGKYLNPPAKFVFKVADYDVATSSRHMIQSDQLDMLYTVSGSIACKAAEFSWVPLATQRNVFGSVPIGCDATVMFSLLNNSAITKVEDLKGKKVGCGALYAGATYYQGLQAFLDHGVHMYRDMEQVRIYGSDYLSYYKAVLNGELDVGIVSAWWLAKNGFDRTGLLRFLDSQELTYEGLPFPATASRITPGFGVVISSTVSWQVKRKILDALRRLNGSNPAMAALKLDGWTSPANYGIALTSLESSGIAYDGDSGKKMCRDPFSREDIWRSIKCPDDHYLVDYNTSARQCELAGHACPAGVVCFCKPCLRKPQNLFRWETVMGLCAALYAVGLFYLFLRPIHRRMAVERWHTHGASEPVLSQAEPAGDVRRRNDPPRPALGRSRESAV